MCAVLPVRKVRVFPDLCFSKYWVIHFGFLQVISDGLAPLLKHLIVGQPPTDAFPQLPGFAPKYPEEAGVLP